MGAADGTDHACSGAPGCDASGTEARRDRVTPSGGASAAPLAPIRRAVASDDLFQGLRELVILHRSEEYRLRITRAGKLILTK